MEKSEDEYTVWLDDLELELKELGIDINEFNIVELEEGKDKNGNEYNHTIN